MIRIVRTPSFSCQTRSIIQKEIRSPKGTGTVFVAPESSKAVIERCVMRSILEELHPGEIKVTAEGGETVPICGAITDGDVLSFIRLGTRILEMTGSDTGSGTDRNLLPLSGQKEWHNALRFACFPLSAPNERDSIPLPCPRYWAWPRRASSMSPLSPPLLGISHLGDPRF